MDHFAENVAASYDERLRTMSDPEVVAATVDVLRAHGYVGYDRYTDLVAQLRRHVVT